MASKMSSEERKEISKNLAEEIVQLSREPFRKLLAELLDARPDLESLQAFANKAPDRFWQAVTQAAKLSGYQEKVIIENNFYMQIQQKSDAELIESLKEMRLQIDKMIPRLPIDVTAEVVTIEPSQ